MIRRVLHLGLLVSAIAVPWWSFAGDGVDALLDFTDSEMRRIQSHGPWPLPYPGDPSNRVSGKREAVEFGEQLFFETRLSKSGTLACGTCHVPELDWSDGLKRGEGMHTLDRNTPNLVNVRYHRWFGWDGAADSLWSQSMRPIVDPRELASNATHVAHYLRADADLSCRYEKSFGVKPSTQDDETVLVGVGKVMAAFQENAKDLSRVGGG